MKLFRSFSAGGSGNVLRDILLVVAIFLLWRGALFGFDIVGMAMTEERNPNYNKDYQAFTVHSFWDSWARWDSGWYKRIVERGYYNEGAQSNTAFFPLYPLAVKGVAKITRNHWVAGLVVSNLSLLFALFFMLGIARTCLDEEAARRSLVYLLIFPSSFFFSAYYTEALFLLTTTASFYFFLKERYFLCAVAGILATMTRSTGVALVGAFIIGYLWNKRFRISQMSPAILWVLAIPLGIGAFMLILKYQMGDPLAFIKSQSGWGRGLLYPTETVINTIKEIDFSLPRNWHNADVFMNLLFTGLFMVVPFVMLGKADISLVIYSLFLVLIPLTTGSVLSMNRFCAVAFPAFLAFARLGTNRTADRFMTFSFAILLGLYSIQFANWNWAG
ncbi:MAG: mannosyltransferase family protein [Myxococcota bacterium]